MINKTIARLNIKVFRDVLSTIRIADSERNLEIAEPEIVKGKLYNKGECAASIVAQLIDVLVMSRIYGENANEQ